MVVVLHQTLSFDDVEKGHPSAISSLLEMQQACPSLRRWGGLLGSQATLLHIQG